MRPSTSLHRPPRRGASANCSSPSLAFAALTSPRSLRGRQSSTQLQVCGHCPLTRDHSASSVSLPVATRGLNSSQASQRTSLGSSVGPSLPSPCSATRQHPMSTFSLHKRQSDTLLMTTRATGKNSVTVPAVRGRASLARVAVGERGPSLEAMRARMLDTVVQYRRVTKLMRQEGDKAVPKFVLSEDRVPNLAPVVLTAQNRGGCTGSGVGTPTTRARGSARPILSLFPGRTFSISQLIRRRK